jgi:hypothetical protein
MTYPNILNGGKWILSIVFLIGVLIGSHVYPNIYSKVIQVSNNGQVFKLLPQYMNRNELAKLITLEGFTTGAEIGVQLGFYAEILLSNWSTCTEYHAIDLWAHQEHYHDAANVNNIQQHNDYQMTRNRLKRFQHVVRYHRNYSNLAVKEIKDNSLDFIYIDARHDYTGVMQDMILYWPKLKLNGIFAGHDYLDVDEARARSATEDWSIDHLGVKRTDNKAVKSAVNEFALKYQRQILVTLPEVWPTWYMRK